MRTAKVLHHRVVTTADAFVFRNAVPEEAMALQAGLIMALEAFVHDVRTGRFPDKQHSYGG